MKISGPIVTSLRMNRQLTENFVADLDDARLTQQPADVINHAAWQLGHITFSLNGACQLARGDYRLPDGWAKLFGAGSQPTSDRASYPSKACLIEELSKASVALEQALGAADDALLSAETPMETLRKVAPTIADALAILAGGHYGYHLGQFSVWRKAMGLSKATRR